MRTHQGTRRTAGVLRTLTIVASSLAALSALSLTAGASEEGAAFTNAGNRTFFAVVAHNWDVDGSGQPRSFIDFNVKVGSRVVLRGEIASAAYDEAANTVLFRGRGLMNGRTPALIEAKLSVRAGVGWLAVRAMRPTDGRVLYQTSRELPMYRAAIDWPQP
jgi:hypothetical protein